MHATRLHRRSFLQAAAMATLAAAGAGRAAATLPRALQLVLPTPPGSQPDIIARWLADPLARQSGLPTTVLNLPGAAGALAADAVLRAAPDSGSLLLGGLDHVAYSHLNSNRRALDPFTDFAPVAAVNRDHWALVTASDAPARSLQALAERARSTPLSYASNGEGSTAHLLSARLCKAAGIDAQHVPYKDPWLPDLIAGRIHFALAPLPALMGPLRGGRVLALATLTDERLPLPGQPPSVRELGHSDQVFRGGLLVFAPAALAAQAGQINRWFVDALGQPEIVQRYRDAFIEPTPLGLDATAELVRARLALVDGMRLAVFGRAR